MLRQAGMEDTARMALAVAGAEEERLAGVAATEAVA